MKFPFSYFGAAALFVTIANSSYGVPRERATPAVRQGVVFGPDGKPAAGATVVYAAIALGTNAPVVTKKTQTNASGAYEVPAPETTRAYNAVVLYVTSSDGVAVVPISSAAAVKLHAKTSIRVRVVDENGLPVAHLSLSPQYFLLSTPPAPSYSPWNKSIATPWNVKTDAQGYATLTDLPQGYTTLLEADDPRFAELNSKNNLVLEASPRTKDQTLHLDHGGSVSGVVLYGPTRQPASNAYVQAIEVGDGGPQGMSKTDKDGHYSIRRLRPGSYNLEVDEIPKTPGQPREWTAAAHPGVAVTGGKQIDGMDFALIHGGVITGHVADSATGKPIQSATVMVTGPANPATSRGAANVSTDSEGFYSLHIPPGTQSVLVINRGSPYAPPQSVMVADGETKTMDFQMAAPPEPSQAHGTVVGPDGAPVANADVLLLGSDDSPRSRQTAQDISPLEAVSFLPARCSSRVRAIWERSKPSKRRTTLP